MEKTFRNFRRRKKVTSFRPNRKFVEKAVDEYLKAGGEITRIELDEESYQAFLASQDNMAEVDEFLSEQ